MRSQIIEDDLYRTLNNGLTKGNDVVPFLAGGEEEWVSLDN